MMFENTQKISSIEFTQNIQCFCPLGDDWYTNNIKVSMVPGNLIPDYCELDDFTRSFGGESLIIEDVIAAIYNHIMDTYKPTWLHVESYVDDAKHMPVKVSRSSGNE